MTTFVLIHGGGGSAWDWHLLDAELRGRGHDVVPAELAAEAMTRGREHTYKAMGEPWPLDRWPEVPTRFLLCRDDRWHEPGFMRELVRVRLGITPDEMDGGHCPALARPKELADRLEDYL